MDKVFHIIVRNTTAQHLFGAWGGVSYVVHSKEEWNVKPGAYITFLGHDDGGGIIVCKKLVSCIPPSHDLNLVNDEAYSWLLSSVRRSVGEAVEIRPPEIVCGLADRSFVLNCNGRMARLAGSHALYCTLGAIKYGRCFSITKAFRREEESSLRHLYEFDLLQFGELDMDVEKLMEYIEFLIRQVHANASLKYPDRTIAKLSKIKFKRLPWRKLRDLSLKSINDYEVLNIDNMAFRDIWKESENPVFVTDMPASLASWNAKIADDGSSTTFNLIFPLVGEVVEGSQRNTDIEDLRRRFRGKKNLASHLAWFLDGLIYPNVPVSVFGMGMERFAMWLYGIRDIKLVRQYTSHIV